MRPVLFHLPDWLGGLAVPSYGAMMFLGVCLAALTFGWLAGRLGVSRGKAFEVTLEIVLVGVLTAKVAGLFFLPSGVPLNFRTAMASGGIWYFGFIFGFAYAAWRSPSIGLRWLDGLDRALPAAAIGHAVGRIGCLLAGCCWGRECSLPWAIRFPETSDAAFSSQVPTGVGLHPTQLYEAGAELALYALMIWWLVRRRPFPGQVTLFYLGAYALVRFVIEFFRADYRGSIGPVSTSQAVALAVLAIVVPVFVVAWRRGGLGVLAELPRSVPAPAERTR